MGMRVKNRDLEVKEGLSQPRATFCWTRPRSLDGATSPEREQRICNLGSDGNPDLEMCTVHLNNLDVHHPTKSLFKK